MIKLVERRVCDLCNAELTDYNGNRYCFICTREVCGNCFKVYSSVNEALQGRTCSQCRETLHEEPRMKEALDKFIQQWKLLSTREHDLSRF